MKKNIKFIGAAAAALLAVAPVVSTGVANAAVVSGGALATDDSKIPVTANTVTFTSTLNDVVNTTKVADLTSNESVLKSLGVQTNDGTKANIVAISQDTAHKTRISDKAVGGTVQKTLTAGNDYYLQTWVTVSGLKPSTKYTFTNADPKEATTTNQGTITNVKIAIKFHVVDPNIAGQPFYANAKNQSYANNQTIPAVNTDGKEEKVNNIVQAAYIINHMDLKSYLGSQDKNGEKVTINADDVLAQLNKQKITVNKDHTINVPSTGFTLTFTRTNPVNGKSATLNVYFKGAGQWNEYPVINFNGAFAKQGESTTIPGTDKDAVSPIATVKLGTDDWASQVIKQFSATQSGVNDSTLKLTTQNLSSSDINTNQSGLYNATLKATNVNGKTTTLNFRVAVAGDNKDALANKTVYTSNTNGVIKLVSIIDGKTSDLEGNVVNQGQSITVYPNDTTTVDGVEYTRVYKANTDRSQNNEWIPTKNITKPVEEKKTEKTIMHVAIVYDKEGKKTSEKIGAYDKVTVLGDIVTINGAKFYKLGENRYVKVGNIDGTMRTLKHNAYIYNNKLKRVQKNTVLKKGSEKRTYGAAFTIKGKKVYRIAKNQYVKVANFK